MRAKLSVLLLLLTLSSFAGQNQTKPGNEYAKEWAKVDSLVAAGLPQSAMEIVNYIYRDSKSKNIAPQFLKTVIFKLKLFSDYGEEYMIACIDTVKKEITTSKGNTAAILHSMLAELYWNYYQSNRYNILSRSETSGFTQTDLRTWDARKIIREVIVHYKASLENTQESKQVKLEDFDPIIYTYSGSVKFRPTLFDFLAHRAIDFFSNSESGLTQPADKFVMRDANYFDPAPSFIKINVATADTFSLDFYAVRLLQDAVSFHLNDSDPQALIDVDLKRLKFVNQKSVSPDKDSLYLSALKLLEKKFPASPFSTDITYEIATEYSTLAVKYAPLGDQLHKWDFKTAMDFCDQAINKFPKSDGASNCGVLKKQILGTTIALTTPQGNIPGKPFLALISYKNAPEMFFRLIKIDPDKAEKMMEDKWGEDIAKEFLKLKSDKEWSQKLPDDGDHQTHTAEIKIPDMPLGYYILLSSDNKDFSYDKKVVAWSMFWVSRLSFINRQKEDYSYDFFVTDRESGAPLKDVKVTTYTRDYNYTLRKYVTNKSKTYNTDANGYVEVPTLRGKNYESNYFYTDFVLGDDRFSTNTTFYQYSYEKPEEQPLKTFFFLDRGIYRPGQTIFFKGILLQKNGDKYEIKPNYAVTIELYDANYQKVSDLYLVTNEYGSYNGTFTAPSNGITGQMYITDKYGTVYFSVEEYKRPKFEVNFEPVKGTYKLNDKVTVKGLAKAYSGIAIDGAQVKYRVVRSGRFPYWGYWWDWYCPASPNMEIVNGNATTDADGKFTIDFNALPDLGIDQKYKPVFDYSVFADVTDINGETHSTSTFISVGYTALIVSVDVPATAERKAKNEWNVHTTNFSGTTEHTNVNIKIYSLKQPDRIFRDRLWAQPDKYTMTKEEFYAAFPNDIYADENSMYKWEKDKEFLSLDMNTAKDSVLKPELAKWPAGMYMLVITAKDKYGTDVESRNYFTLFSKDDKQIPSNDYGWYSPLKTDGEPGEQASFLFGSRDKKINLLYEIELKGKIIKREWVSIEDEMKRFDIPITEDYRGNFIVHLAYIKDNRFKNDDVFVTVPYSNKMLDLEFESFRDKLQPGQQEEWRILVKGAKGDKVAAEMVAALYDASLDAFRGNSWYFNILDYGYSTMYWDASRSFQTNPSGFYIKPDTTGPHPVFRYYDYLNWFGLYMYGTYNYRYATKKGAYKADFDIAGNREEGEGWGGGNGQAPATGKAVAQSTAEEKVASVNPVYDAVAATASIPMAGEAFTWDGKGKDKGGHEGGGIQVRKNFNETAFFFPSLMTNDKGEVIIKFSIPEALTKWKMMGFAHTKDLRYGQIEKEVVTQKELMIVPNQPRFFREGDKFFFTAKVSNVSDKDISGEATLQFFDATTMSPVDAQMKNTNLTQPFNIVKGQSTALNWEISIPEGIGAITYRITAKADKYSDGEEMAIPVLTNRMLVTETLPLPINGKQKKNFTFDKLLNSSGSTTLRHQKLTLEFTSNPAWYAIQALPYLMEFPYECSEQTFERFYANSIASFVANSSPRIKQVFDSWKNFTPEALLSNLEKNQDLKALMLEETPWVLDAKSETERKQRVALLFDLNKMSNELDLALVKLQKKQASNGGWPWFDGMPDDRYITQYIITGFGHLDHLGIKNIRDNNKVWTMVNSGVKYLDERIREDYEDILKYYPKEMDKNHTSYEQIQYLYARSYFKDIAIDNRNQKAFDYFKGQAAKYWNDFSKYMQGMIALALNRYDEKTVPQNIIKSMKENALHSEEMGMFWRDMENGYYWYQAPVETQALLIECFDEVAQDKASVEEMKIWLLKQKQTQDWKTTKATAEACYALLLRGTDLLASSTLVEVNVGGTTIDPKTMDDVKVEAGTGYFRTSWPGGSVKPEMGNITVTKTDDGVAWGAMYWQYFEQLDKITPAKTPLSLVKKLFVERTTPTGLVIEPVTGETKLKVGDKLKVRIELRVDRDMEYVHMKDMRASGFEPTNVLSTYKYQDGLGYYESTRDASTNFFFSYLPKGTYVFEYPMFVNNRGDFSNGVTSIQCMYAPEFSSHSEGIRVKVE